MAKVYRFSLIESMEFIAGLNFKSREDFRSWREKQPEGWPIPYNPEKYYRGFPGWVVFLGSGFVSQIELRAIVQDNKIQCEELYRKFARDFGDVLRIPVYPEKHYRTKGQVFMGFKKLLYRHQRCLSCASLFAKKSGITSATMWRRQGRRKIPRDMPLELSEYGDIDVELFLSGKYYEANKCTCEK